jgi:preprotein translocase, secG subunit
LTFAAAGVNIIKVLQMQPEPSTGGFGKRQVLKGLYMSTLTVLLYALVVVVALLLIGIILVQPSKSGGMGAAFGGVGESVFGAQAGSHLTKATVIMTAVFFLVTLVLASLIGHGVNKGTTDGVTAALESTAAASAVAPEAQPEAPAAQSAAPQAAEQK